MTSRTQNAAIAAAVVLLCLHCHTATALVYFSGGCPSVEPVAYDATAITGVWYEARRNPWIVEAGSRCVSWEFTESDTGTLDVATSLRFKLVTKSMTSTLTQVEGSSDANFTFDIKKLPGLIFGLPSSTLQIVDVTADYLVAFSCTPKLFGWKSKQLLWVLTSDQNPTAAVVSAGISAATSAGISTSRLEVVSQSNC